MGVGGMTVCCLGIIGNILSFIVLTRKTMKSSTYTYLSGLAICDLLVLITSVLMFHKDVKYPERGVIYWIDNYYSQMFPVVHPLAVTFQITSVWLTLAFTVDRYIMICHPFKAERMCDISRARRVVLALYIGGVIFNIPRFLEYETNTVELPNNITRIFIKFTELGQNEVFKTTVHLWLYFIFVCLIPFFTMAILNAFLIHAVHQSRKRGKAINAKEKRRNDTTVMLIGVIIIFFICQTPALISRMMWSLPTTVTSTRYRLLNEIGNFLVILNSATNIIPYYFFGQRFRNEFWRSFCFCFIGKENVRRLARSMSLSFDRRFSNASTIVRAIELNGLPTHDGQRSQKDSVVVVVTVVTHRALISNINNNIRTNNITSIITTTTSSSSSNNNNNNNNNSSNITTIPITITAINTSTTNIKSITIQAKNHVTVSNLDSLLLYV
uniref:G-protein coupled receptors family 1 profile domain-containing protein n=1 Tax=Octopus bimaculoides TaxID=37653 RepID=A0A0L8GX94_OCTBM